MPIPGIGAANVCALEEAHPDDALLPALLSPDGRPPATLAVFVTQLLTDAHQQIMHALMVGEGAGKGEGLCIAGQQG